MCKKYPTIKLLALILTGFLLASCFTQPPPEPITKSVNLNKANGRWYEIAAIPKSFAANCYCSYGTYQYTGKVVKVQNSCRRTSPTGPVSNAQATLYPVPGSNNTKLEVKFSWPFSGKYYVLYMSPDYEYAIGGTPNRNNLWITARKPHISEAKYQQLVGMAESLGYPVNRLKKTNQSCKV